MVKKQNMKFSTRSFKVKSLLQHNHLPSRKSFCSPGLYKARDRACGPPHAPCFVKVRDKHLPRKMFTLLRAPGNRTVCKKKELFCLLFLGNSFK